METWSSRIEEFGQQGNGRVDGAVRPPEHPSLTFPLQGLRVGLELQLIRQAADVGRPFSVAVHRRGICIGHLPRADARLVARLLDEGGWARAFVLALAYRRPLFGPPVLSRIAIEIETSEAGDLWSRAERADMAGRGTAVDIRALHRPHLPIGGVLVGVVCAGLAAAAAVAAMPGVSQRSPAFDRPPKSFIVAVAGPLDSSAPLEGEGPGVPLGHRMSAGDLAGDGFDALLPPQRLGNDAALLAGTVVLAAAEAGAMDSAVANRQLSPPLPPHRPAIRIRLGR